MEKFRLHLTYLLFSISPIHWFPNRGRHVRLNIPSARRCKMDDCCLRGFQWDAKPKGTSEIDLAGRKCYVTGSNPDRAIMIIHDLFGWTFPNTQILADHFAEEVNATVYIPDL